MAEFTRDADIRPGSVIQRPESPKPMVVLKVRGDKIACYILATRVYHEPSGYLYDAVLGRLFFPFELLMNAPKAYIHSWVVTSALPHLDTAKGRRALREYILPRLMHVDRLENEYGEYWIRSTVERLTKDFEAANLPLR